MTWAGWSTIVPGHHGVADTFTAADPSVTVRPSGKRATYFMSDTHVVPEGTALLSPEAMGTFDENGDYIPRSVDRGRPGRRLPRRRHGRHHRRVRGR